MRAVDFVGIDIGSTYAKVAVLDEAGRPALMEVLPSGWNSVETAGRIWELLKASKVDTAQMYCTATGYGRGSVAFADRAVTEITCHGKGAAWLFGKGSFRIIDIGGQDTKVIAMDSRDGNAFYYADSQNNLYIKGAFEKINENVYAVSCDSAAGKAAIPDQSIVYSDRSFLLTVSGQQLLFRKVHQAPILYGDETVYE